MDDIFYIDIEDQHPDTMRFLKDCENALNTEIKILKSRYASVENTIRTFGYFRIAKTGYAPCTNILKKRVRKEWEYTQGNTQLEYIWGYDSTEKNRAKRLQESIPEYFHIFPLIDENLTKGQSHGFLSKLGIRRPEMYELGYKNNNCIGCVKGGMGYWNKIRHDFPDVFEKRAKLERELNSRCLKECFLDELDPNRGRIEDEIADECGIMCNAAYEKSKI